MTSTNAMKRQVGMAFAFSWLILSLGMACAILSPFFLGEEFILSIAGKLQHGHPQATCPMCGMTRAFIAIANGNPDQAVQLNRGSIPLFAAFAGNTCLAVFFLPWCLYRFRPGACQESIQCNLLTTEKKHAGT
tara:strand:- start:114 stop:512 length:399 start_codon:yes stop_codon:yes gene_type:complete